jgi:hypothetical protein
LLFLGAVGGWIARGFRRRQVEALVSEHEPPGTGPSNDDIIPAAERRSRDRELAGIFGFLSVVLALLGFNVRSELGVAGAVFTLAVGLAVLAVRILARSRLESKSP